ncbi:MAG: hypothetical protein NTY38_15565 [Acidobacteria bacterium]|nr:hypothetical protein [Acidobacteriota bacterium]
MWSRTLTSLLLLAASGAGLSAEALPDAYFRLMKGWSELVRQRLDQEPNATLLSIESGRASRHFPYAILPPAVLYAKKHPKNASYHDKAMLALAIRIGDLLADADEKGTFEPRLDSDWDNYAWMETYRLLKPELGAERDARWKKAIMRNIALFEEDAKARLDFPWYNSPYIGTSPNHFSLWAAGFVVGGKIFDRKDWVDLGSRILKRYAAVEQTEDGYWGEHSRQGPTIGYNHLTLSAVALYAEYSHDPVATQALRRATTFHENFTYLDGVPMELLNNRNRYWGVSAWAQFGFSQFPDGRRYAEFLTGFFKPDQLQFDVLGRVAQDALYYHDGPKAPIPQDRENYHYQMSIPAGVRKTGPWQVGLSGIVETQAINSQFYLDRQSAVSVFHQKTGLIISGANSKRQPELATFSEKYKDVVIHMPLSSRLQMNDQEDRLSLAFLQYFADLYVPKPSAQEVTLRFVTSRKGRPESPMLTLQLCLKAGETLETGAGKKFEVSAEKLDLSPEQIGGWIRHHGWTLKVDPAARLTWPVYPFNPYGNGTESNLGSAVAALATPLKFATTGKYVHPNEQELRFTVSVP